MNKKRKRANAITVLGFVGLGVLCMVGIFVYILMHNKGYKNDAIERGDGIILNDVRYEQCVRPEECTITNVIICKTDTGMKIYEIEEYPGYEYIAAYSQWDGSIYKRAE